MVRPLAVNAKAEPEPRA